MINTLVTSNDVEKRYRYWTKKIIKPFGRSLNYGEKIRFVINRPISAIYILNENDYEDAHSAIGNNWRGIEPNLEFYGKIPSVKRSKLKSLLSEQPTIIRDIGPAFWVRPIKNQNVSNLVNIRRKGSYVFICPDKIKRVSKQIMVNLPEIESQELEFKLFKVALIHEIGHHYSYSNLSKKQIKFLKNGEDLNMSEGLANWFTYKCCLKDERFILAENSLRQRPSYRYYFILRYADIMNILDYLLNKNDVLSGLKEFAQIIGGKLDLNGKMLSIETNATGFIMDWYDKGGIIIAGESIQALCPMKNGCFITPKIEFLIGRFPSNTLVITNEISNIEDYGSLPSNIVILPKQNFNIQAIINRYPKKKDKNHLKSILEDIGLLNEWVDKLNL